MIQFNFFVKQWFLLRPSCKGGWNKIKNSFQIHRYANWRKFRFSTLLKEAIDKAIQWKLYIGCFSFASFCHLSLSRNQIWFNFWYELCTCKILWNLKKNNRQTEVVKIVLEVFVFVPLLGIFAISQNSWKNPAKSTKTESSIFVMGRIDHWSITPNLVRWNMIMWNKRLGQNIIYV